MDKSDIAIIGAGVVGLAVAAEISQRKRHVIILEQHPSFGQETSGRNSEVIHSGLYCPPESLKAKLCVEGNKLLYQLCQKEPQVKCNPSGKLIVATCADEIEVLEMFLQQGRQNGVENLHFLSRKALDEYSPVLKAEQAIHSASTGIIDAQSLMAYLEFKAMQQKVAFSYDSKVTSVKKDRNGYILEVLGVNGETKKIFSEVVINCAGLCSDKIAETAGLDIDELGYKLHYTKGEYFTVRNKNTVPLNVLIYRARKGGRIGIHTVIDRNGQVKLGPKSYRIEKNIEYSVDSSHKLEFYDSCKSFLPLLELEDLCPDMAGISPRLEASPADYVIANEQKNGLPNFINLIGMDSPALTACLAIARHVNAII